MERSGGRIRLRRSPRSGPPEPERPKSRSAGIRPERRAPEPRHATGDRKTLRRGAASGERVENPACRLTARLIARLPADRIPPLFEHERRDVQRRRSRFPLAARQRRLHAEPPGRTVDQPSLGPPPRSLAVHRLPAPDLAQGRIKRRLEAGSSEPPLDRPPTRTRFPGDPAAIRGQDDHGLPEVRRKARRIEREPAPMNRTPAHNQAVGRARHPNTHMVDDYMTRPAIEASVRAALRNPWRRTAVGGRRVRHHHEGACRRRHLVACFHRMLVCPLLLAKGRHGFLKPPVRLIPRASLSSRGKLSHPPNRHSTPPALPHATERATGTSARGLRPRNVTTPP